MAGKSRVADIGANRSDSPVFARRAGWRFRTRSGPWNRFRGFPRSVPHMFCAAL